MTVGDPRLQSLRGALIAAAGADLARAEEPRPRRSRSTRAKLAIALIAAVLAVPAGALAVRALSANEEVAHGLPAGSVVLIGTEPNCVALRRNVEYDCALSNPPREEPPEPGSTFEPGTVFYNPHVVMAVRGHWQGYVVDTVDASNHVNGGCRSQNDEGARWLCYVGEESVKQKILGPAALGWYLPEPAGP